MIDVSINILVRAAPPSPLITKSPQIMVANIRCAEIREQQLSAFLGDQAWDSLKAEGMTGIVQGFSARAASLADSCIAG